MPGSLLLHLDGFGGDKTRPSSKNTALCVLYTKMCYALLMGLFMSLLPAGGLPSTSAPDLCSAVTATEQTNNATTPSLLLSFAAQ